MRLVIASLAGAALLCGCASGARPAPPPVTTTVTQIVTQTETKTATATATVSVPAPMPKACEAAIADLKKLLHIVGDSEGLVSDLEDLISDYQAEAVAGLASTKSREEITKLHERLSSGTLAGNQLISQLQDDDKECRS